MPSCLVDLAGLALAEAKVDPIRIDEIERTHAPTIPGQPKLAESGLSAEPKGRDADVKDPATHKVAEEVFAPHHAMLGIWKSASRSRFSTSRERPVAESPQLRGQREHELFHGLPGPLQEMKTPGG